MRTPLSLLRLNKLLALQNQSIIPPNACQCSSRRHKHTKTTATVFEVLNGVGGSEAMIFAEEMLTIYQQYFEHMRWNYSIIEKDRVKELKGLRSTKLVINSASSFEGLIQEAGVHRVQRIPKTERHGRMHTSTITVSVTPKSVLELQINESDIEMQTKRASGPGGQHVNKTESAVRLVHKPTGVTVESQESRFQMDNKKLAMKKLLDKLRAVEMERLTSQRLRMRKEQLGNADRSDKIRTYNFPQDRITDHRLGKNYGNLRGLFSGDLSILEKLINDYHQSCE